MSILFSLLLLGAASAYVMRTKKSIQISALLFAIVTGGASLYVALSALFGHPIFVLSGWFHNSFYAWFMFALVAFCYMAATMVSVRYVGEEFDEGILELDKVRLYYLLLPLFVLTMMISVLADNLGLMWIGLEGTTLATTMLVALYRKDASIEAAWKFIILCSIGIGLGLIGMLMFIRAGLAAGMNTTDAFSLSALKAHATLLNAANVKLAFVFVLVGIGTKVGFVPMHTWLPDAHSKTPSPISALLSGILLNVALFIVLLFKGLTDIALNASVWSDRLLRTFGVLSVVAAAFFLLQQRNYKRMLAYSSVEHMGLMAFGAALGPVGMIAITIHAIAHTLTKSTLFYLAGEMLLLTRTTKIAGVKQFMKYAPITATLFVFAILAIIAVPPSAMFTSEFLLVSTGLQSHLWVTLLILLSLSLIALSMLKSTFSLLYALPEEGETYHTPHEKERFTLTHGVAVVQLGLIIAFGCAITTEPVMQFFTLIAKSI